MRQFLKWAARRLSRIPVVGWIVEIAAAAYHLPEIRGQAQAAWAKSEADDVRFALLDSRCRELAARTILLERELLETRSQELARRLAAVEVEFSEILPQALNVIASGNHQLRAMARRIAAVEQSVTALKDRLATGDARAVEDAPRRADEELRDANDNAEAVREIVRSVRTE